MFERGTVLGSVGVEPGEEVLAGVTVFCREVVSLLWEADIAATPSAAFK
jgi:hypothetical protein